MFMEIRKNMDLKTCISQVKENTNWKSESKIVGEACEYYVKKNIKCIRCNDNKFEKYKTNQKSKDLICNNCNQKYQIKGKSATDSQVNNDTLKLTGADYLTTLNNISENIDYLIILYEKHTYIIKSILYIKSENINSSCIVPRKPLSPHAKRAGWQGCTIIFNNIIKLQNYNVRKEIIVKDIIKMNTEEEIEKDKYIKSEQKYYDNQKDKAKFKTPEEEYDYSKITKKVCSKCKLEKSLLEYNGNTSGTDAFNKDGYRLKRPECSECTKMANKGKIEAKKLAKEQNIPYKAPEGTVCAICKKEGPMVFDHCHTKNVFRGYCCDPCNRSLGVLGDNVEGLLKAINYLLISEPCEILQNENHQLVIIT